MNPRIIIRQGQYLMLHRHIQSIHGEIMIIWFSYIQFAMCNLSSKHILIKQIICILLLLENLVAHPLYLTSYFRFKLDMSIEWETKYT